MLRAVTWRNRVMREERNLLIRDLVGLEGGIEQGGGNVALHTNHGPGK